MKSILKLQQYMPRFAKYCIRQVKDDSCFPAFYYQILQITFYLKIIKVNQCNLCINKNIFQNFVYHTKNKINLYWGRSFQWLPEARWFCLIHLHFLLMILFFARYDQYLFVNIILGNRKTGATNLNERSSRSHCIFQLVIFYFLEIRFLFLVTKPRDILFGRFVPRTYV